MEVIYLCISICFFVIVVLITPWAIFYCPSWLNILHYWDWCLKKQENMKSTQNTKHCCECGCGHSWVINDK